MSRERERQGGRPPPPAPTWSAPEPELQRCCCATRAPRRPPRAAATATAAIARLPLERRADETHPSRHGPRMRGLRSPTHAFPPAAREAGGPYRLGPAAPRPLRSLRPGSSFPAPRPGGSSPGRGGGSGRSLPLGRAPGVQPRGARQRGRGRRPVAREEGSYGRGGGACCYGARGGHVPRAPPAPPASAPCSRARARRHVVLVMAAAGEPGAGGAAEEAFLTFYNEVPAPQRRRGGGRPRLAPLGPARPRPAGGGLPSRRRGLAGRAAPGPARPP